MNKLTQASLDRWSVTEKISCGSVNKQPVFSWVPKQFFTKYFHSEKDLKSIHYKNHCWK